MYLARPFNRFHFLEGNSKLYWTYALSTSDCLSFTVKVKVKETVRHIATLFLPRCIQCTISLDQV